MRPGMLVHQVEDLGSVQVLAAGDEPQLEAGARVHWAVASRGRCWTGGRTMDRDARGVRGGGGHQPFTAPDMNPRT